MKNLRRRRRIYDSNIEHLCEHLFLVHLHLLLLPTAVVAALLLDLHLLLLLHPLLQQVREERESQKTWPSSINSLSIGIIV